MNTEHHKVEMADKRICQFDEVQFSSCNTEELGGRLNHCNQNNKHSKDRGEIIKVTSGRSSDRPLNLENWLLSRRTATSTCRRLSSRIKVK